MKNNPYRPALDYSHALREIIINREDPCELVRELISNSRDAHAYRMFLLPYIDKQGLVYHDNGIGLSMKNGPNNISPYHSFFSIGRPAKARGDGIGYKGVGSKLCFASRRFGMITRCKGEKAWRYKIIDNPMETLSQEYDLKPETTTEPWVLLRERLVPNPGVQSELIHEVFCETYFKWEFASGTMIFLEDIDVDDYYERFVIQSAKSYLYNYIRYKTAHGDVRIISEEDGFFAEDVKKLRDAHNIPYWDLAVLVSNKADEPGYMARIPRGFPWT